MRYRMGVPKFRTPTTVRLESEYKGLEKLRSESTILTFQAAGDPPDRYEMEFHGKCLVSSGKGVKLGNFQKFQILLGAEFPRRAPQVHWLTPIVHPNMSGGSVCMGNFAANWTPSFHLADLVEVLWDMTRMAVFNVHSAYGHEGKKWEELDQEFHFPVDRRPLRDKALPNDVGSSIVRPSGEEDDILIIDDDSCRMGSSEESDENAAMELDMARNMFGPLKPDIRKRLQAVLNNPSEKTWADAYALIVGGDRFMTLWQAVLRVDPTFPRTGPATDRKGRVVEGWSRIPDRALLIRALKYATH